MPQEYLGGCGDVYLGLDCVPVPEIPLSDSQALSPHQIVPMLMGSQSRDEVEMLAAALAAAGGGRGDVLLVASSDLSHYHPAPMANRTSRG